MKADIWMPLYVSDYLRDTMRLNCEQHGAYLLLLMSFWIDNGEMPDDDEQFASILRTTPEHWKTKLRPVISRFFSVSGGKWVHERVKREKLKAISLSEKRSHAGKQGGRPPKAIGKANHKANGKQNETPSPSPSPSQQPSETPSERERPRARDEVPFPEIEVPGKGDVLAYASTIGLPDWKAIDWFNEMQGCGWKDKHNREVRNWRALLDRVKGWWESDGRPSSSSRTKGGVNGRHNSPADLRTIIQAKESVAAQIRTKWCSDTAMSAVWSDKEKKAEFFKLKREIKSLQVQLSNMG